MQYLIVAVKGEQKDCCLITGNKANAVERLKTFREVVQRDNIQFELREYVDSITTEYVVLDI